MYVFMTGATGVMGRRVLSAGLGHPALRG